MLYNDTHTLIWGLFFIYRCSSGSASKWLLHNMKCGLTGIECTHSPSQYNEMPRIGFITCNRIYLFDSFKGSYIITYWNNFDTAYIMLLNESHTLIWGVILWYDEKTPVVLMSLCKMSPPHHATRSHRYWIFFFAKPLSGQKRKPSHTISGWIRHM